MKKILIASVLFVSACATGADYVPALSQAPSDSKKFQSDVAQCNKEADARGIASQDNHRIDGALGPVGYVIGKANAKPSDDYYKTPGEMVEECLTARGYKLAR